MSNTVGGISNIRATDGGNIASFRSKDSKIGQYIDVNGERVVINYMENGEWKTGFVLASKSDLNNIVTSENINPISFTAGEIKTLTVKTNCNDYVPYVVRERTSGKPLVVANFWLEASNVSKIILYAPLSITNVNIDIYFIKRYW